MPQAETVEDLTIESIVELISATMDSVAYGRGLLPDGEFQWRPISFFDGGKRATGTMRLPRIVNRGGSDALRTMSAWVNWGVSEAIRRRYLRSAALVVLDADGSALERYTFKLAYPTSDRIDLDVAGPRSAAGALPSGSSRIALIESVIGQLNYLTSALPPLSAAACEFTMKLGYNELAPPRYSPPAFELCSPDTFSFQGKGLLSLSMSQDSEVSGAPGSDVLPLTIGGLKLCRHECKIIFKGPAPNIAQVAGDSADAGDSRAADVRAFEGSAWRDEGTETRCDTTPRREGTETSGESETRGDSFYSPRAAPVTTPRARGAETQPKKKRRPAAAPHAVNADDDAENARPTRGDKRSRREAPRVFAETPEAPQVFAVYESPDPTYGRPHPVTVGPPLRRAEARASLGEWANPFGDPFGGAPRKDPFGAPRKPCAANVQQHRRTYGTKPSKSHFP